MIAPEGKAREGEEEEDSPPRRGAEPKKTIPKPEFTGKASALYDLVKETARWVKETAPDIVKVNELIDAGIDLRYQVRSLVRADTIH